MDDVDRLYECFKCGVSPPQSAIRERKRGSRTLKRVDSAYAQPAERISKGTANAKHFCNDSSSSKVKRNSNWKQFSPLVFYRSPHGVPPKRPASLLRLLQEIHVDLGEQNKQRKEVWATFPKQDEAVKHAKQFMNARVFSYQDHFNGQRRFLVSTYEDFWRRYKYMNSRRHHYEVIQEGMPCHLYFDLEFNKRANKDKNGDEMVDLLVMAVFDTLLEKYSLEGSHDWIVELDSSTEDKFSRHLIIRIPKAAFKDNSHVGAFVAEICSRIYTSNEMDERFKKLFVFKDSESVGILSQIFVDTAVYSRNRCFRLALSSKAGKTSVLLPSGRFKCEDMSEEEMFMASLICNMDADCEKLLVCKMDSNFVKTLHFDTEVTENFQQNFIPHASVLNSFEGDPSRTYLMGKSPFTALDAFIVYIASIGSVPGKVRSWYWFSEYGLMVYNMSKNRYCERIQREHKSNHVMYVVDLKRGVYYQKCHDPDCRGYRSPLRPIPDNVIARCSASFNVKGNAEGLGHRVADSDESIIDNCKKDWWLETIKFADQDNVGETPGEDDEDWWTTVEKIATQTERAYLGIA